MKNLIATFMAQGRATRHPGKQAVVDALLRGEHVELRLGRDEGKEHIVLINPETNETCGSIDPNPSYGEDYDLLEAFIDTSTPMDVVAFETCGKDHHYKVQVAVTIDD